MIGVLSSILSWIGHVVAALFGLLFVTGLYRFLQWIFSPLRKLPGPKNRGGILGNLPELMKEPYMDPEQRWWKEAGLESSLIHFNVLLWGQAVLVLDKDIIQKILTASPGKESPRFSSRVVTYFKSFLGSNVMSLFGPHWTRHRRILQPAFNTRFLRECMDNAVPPRMNRFIKAWKKAASEKREIDVSSNCSALTLDIVGDVAFSHDFHALNAIEKWAAQGEQSNDEIDLVGLGDPLLTYFMRHVGPNFVSVVCLMLRLEEMDQYVNPNIWMKRRTYDQEVKKVVENASKDNLKAKSLLHLMLHAHNSDLPGKEGNFSQDEIRDNVKVFMVAGHETTSTWLYWTLFVLAQHPDIQEKVHDEVVQYSKTGDGVITMEDVDKMQYMNAMLQEVLRLYPPVAHYSRYTTTTESWHGADIPPDTRLVLSPFLLHRHPKYWQDPEVFMPERWIHVSPDEQERRRFAFFPFSAGGKACIGQAFATMEIQLILAPLIRAFEFRTAPSQRSTNYEFVGKVTTMKSKPLLKVVVQERGQYK